MGPVIGAIILAAGRSGRMGQCKALLDIGGKTAIEQIRETLFKAGVEDQVIVTGHHTAEIALALPIGNIVYNPDHASGGMISSVKVGLRALKGRCQGILINLVDHPLVESQTVRQLIDAWILDPNKIVQPGYHNKMGHPVIIPASAADSILQLPADATLKTWMTERSNDILVVDVDDEGVVMDLDTPADYEQAIKQWRMSEVRS